MSEDLDTQKEVLERGKFAQEIGVKGWIHRIESSRLIEGVKEEGRSKISGCIMEIALYFLLLFLYVGGSFSLTFSYFF